MNPFKFDIIDVYWVYKSLEKLSYLLKTDLIMMYIFIAIIFNLLKVKPLY